VEYFAMAQLPTALKIAAIIIVASWACAGAIRLLYPGVWKWIIQKLGVFLKPCNFCFYYIWPEEMTDSSRFKQPYILPMSFPNGDHESFSKSFSDPGRRRKSEGSLRLERRKTELNVTIPNVPSTDTQNETPETPTESRNRSQSKTKKEGRRRGQGWGRGGPGRGRGRGRAVRESGFVDYPFSQPNYDYPPDTVPPDRVRGPSEFDILNPLQPSLGNASALLELESGPLQGRKSSSKILVRSFSTNTTSFSGPSRPSSALTSPQKGRKSELTIPQSADALLLDI
jgi:hypothetical protein